MAGTSDQQPAAAIWNEDGRRKNISTGLMRPLYTSCREHFHAQEKNQQQSYSHPSNNGGILKNTCLSNESTIPRQPRPRFLTLNSLPRMPSTSPETQKRDPMSSPFLRLPTEIRLQVYSLLVLPHRESDLLPSFEKIAGSAHDYCDYEGKQKPNINNPTIRLRTVDPTKYTSRFGTQYRPPHTRSAYHVRAERSGARCMKTTYHSVNTPRIEDNLSILRTNKQIHAEAAELLYSSYTFDFDTHIEAIVPFLSDLTPFARSCIKSMRFLKRAWAFEKEFDKCEWSTALRYLTSPHNSISLRRLEFGVVGGRHGERGWDRIPRYSSKDFELVKMMEGMEWMQYLEEIEGLQELEVFAVIEQCSPATVSANVANFTRFSASVDGGFKGYLEGKLLGGGGRQQIVDEVMA